MSRSRKKTPIIPMTTSESDKPFKVDEHRRERRVGRAVLTKTRDGDHRRLQSKAFGNPSKAPKDGKQYWPRDPAATRK